MKHLKHIWLLIVFLFLSERNMAQCMNGIASYTFDCLTSTAVASVTIVQPSGPPPYTYTWIPTGINTATAGNLAAGTYTINFTNANNCSGYTQLIIGNPYGPTNINMTYTNVTCYGASNGMAHAVFVGSGGPPFSYTWSPAAYNSGMSTAPGLPAGDYTVTIKDHNGCMASNSVVISEPTEIVSVLSNTFVPCHGGTTSSTITSTGGMAPYTYSVNGFSSPFVATLSAGVQTIATKDHLGCIKTNTVLLTQAPQTQISFNPVSPSCHGRSDGSVTTVVNGSSPTYTYAWSFLNIPTSYLNNIPSGTYTLNIKDTSHCITHSVVIVQPPVPISLSAQTHPENCSASDGAFMLTISGGTGPYTQTVFPLGTSLTTASLISSGIYTTVITDSKACVDTTWFTVGNLSTVTLSIVNYTPVLCNGECNGAVQLSVQNGVAPFTYSATGTPTTVSSLISGLCAGPHMLTVIDAHGCPANTDLDFPVPPAFSFSATAPSVICSGKSAILHAVVSGSNSAYTFAWSPGGLSGQDAYVAPGSTTGYSLSVYDANHCTHAPYQFTVNVNPKLSIRMDAQVGGICPGTTAQITPTINGGDGNYMYQWLPGNQTEPFIEVADVSIPEYTLIVNDGCGSPPIVQLIPVDFFLGTHPEMSVSGSTGCEPFNLTFVNKTAKSKHAVWNYGDKPFEQEGDTTRYCYQHAGIYNVNLSLIDSNSCKASFTYTGFIHVLKSPHADFITRPSVVTLNNADQVELRSSAGEGTACQWYSAGRDLGNMQSIYYTFPDTGSYTFMLIMRNGNSCVDTLVKDVHVIEGFNFYMPTAFTPNGNAINDLLTPMGTGWQSRDYEFEVYNRWGNKIFRTNNISEGWDGGRRNDKHDPGNSKYDQEDTYAWRVVITDNQDIKHYFAGQVVVLR